MLLVERPISVPRSRFLLGLSVVVLGLTLIEAVDVFELPFEGAVGSVGVGGVFGALVQLERSVGYPGLFVLMFLESASLPVPSEVVLPLAGYLVYLGEMGFAQALLVATAGGVAGSYVDYYLARVLGRPILVRVLAYIHVGGGSLARAEAWFNRGGALAVLLARFVPLIRTLISFPAGLLRMDVKRFGLVTFGGTLGWSALLVYAGYSAGALWGTATSRVVGALDTLVVYALLVLSAAYITLYFAGFSTRKPDKLSR